MNIRRKNNLVTQSNHLIESRYFLTVGEQKIILLLISMISPDDVDLKEYEMKVMDFAEIMGMTGHSVYERLNDTLDKLLSRVIHIPKPTGYLKIGWISSAEYIEGEGTIRISFDKKLKPYLLGLKKEFTRYKLSLVTQFKSSYTIRIYMLLKQYENIGKREIDLYDLREMLNMNRRIYPDFKRFRYRILNQAKKEFETKDKETGFYQSDITFDLKTIRKGRKISRLRFIIKNQNNQKPLTIKPLKKPKDTPAKPKALKPDNKPNIKPKTLSPAVQALARHNIKEHLATTFETDQGEAAVLNCVKLYEEKLAQGKINDLSGGYLISMLEAKAGIKSQAEIEREQNKEKEQRIKREKEQEQRLADYKNKVIVHFEREIKKQFLSQLNQAQKEILWAEIKSQIKYAIPSVLIKKGEELKSPVVGSELSKHIPNYEERKTNYINLKMAQKRAELFGNVDDF